MWDRTCEFHTVPAVTSTPLRFSRHFLVVGMRKTIHFLEHRSSAKSQTERGLTGQWIARPSELGQKEVRASVGVFGGVGKQTPPHHHHSRQVHLATVTLEPRQRLGGCSAPGPLQRKQFYFLGSVLCPYEQKSPHPPATPWGACLSVHGFSAVHTLNCLYLVHLLHLLLSMMASERGTAGVLYQTMLEDND